MKWDVRALKIESRNRAFTEWALPAQRSGDWTETGKSIREWPVTYKDKSIMYQSPTSGFRVRRGT